MSIIAQQVQAQPARLPLVGTVIGWRGPLGRPISASPAVDTAPQLGVKIYDKSGSSPGGSSLNLPSSSYGTTTTDGEYVPGVSASPARACATVKVEGCGY